ncbi:MAG TPA: sigma-70 family RNA polymerase sigma factor [Candidatus Binatia bacterium]
MPGAPRSAAARRATLAPDASRDAAQDVAADAVRDAAPDATTDAALLERVARGDTEALARLAERYHDRFHRVAWRMLGNEHDAEDCVQIAFLKIHLHAAEFRARWQGSTWLYRILTNVCIDAWRKRRHEDLVAESSARSQGASVADRMDVQAALARLPAETRVVVVLRYLEDLPYEEIARVRGVTVNTVKTQLRRGKQALRRHLGGKR